MFPLADAADNVEPTFICLVVGAGADLADSNVLLRLTDYLALLPFAATFVLGTGNNPMVRNWLVEPVVEVSVSLEPTDLANALAG